MLEDMGSSDYLKGREDGRYEQICNATEEIIEKAYELMAQVPRDVDGAKGIFYIIGGMWFSLSLLGAPMKDVYTLQKASDFYFIRHVLHDEN